MATGSWAPPSRLDACSRVCTNSALQSHIDDQCTTIQIPTSHPWCCWPRTRNRRVPAIVGLYLTQTIWQSRRPSHWELECDARGLLAVSTVLGSVPTSEKQTSNRPREPGKGEPGSGDRAHRTDNNQKQKQDRPARGGPQENKQHPGTDQKVGSFFSIFLCFGNTASWACHPPSGYRP